MNSVDSFRLYFVENFRPKRLDDLSLSWIYGASIELINNDEDGEAYLVCCRDIDRRVFRNDEGKYFTESDDDYVFRSEDLPIEFFNHQLLEIDPTSCSNDDLLAFARAWGFVYSPFRESLADDVKEPYGHDLLTRSAQAIAKTEAAIVGNYFPSDENHPCMYSDSRNSRPCISVLEMRVAIETIQFLVNEFFLYDSEILDEVKRSSDLDVCKADLAELDSISAKDKAPELEGLLFALCNPSMMGGFPDYTVSLMDNDSCLYCRGMLTVAIYFQLFEAINDSTPWRLCECEGCNRIFKHKQSIKRKSEQSKHNRDDSAYCCDACKERQMKRNQRKKNK